MPTNQGRFRPTYPKCNALTTFDPKTVGRRAIAAGASTALRLRGQIGIWLVCVLLAALKVWMTSGQRISALGASPHDDFHFLTQAASILAGEWLGPYDNLTLIKGPFFSIWIVMAHLAGVPLLVSVQLLYAFACGVFTLAVAPLLRQRAMVVFVYAFILFNPQSSADTLTRLRREMLTPALTLLVAACAIGLWLARRDQRALRTAWAAGLAAAFACLWLTREEQTATVVPYLVFAAVTALLVAFRNGGPTGLWPALRPWLGAAVLWAAFISPVYLLNFSHYGLLDKTEFDAYPFRAAYGALSRVKPREFKPLVPVARETRYRIYRVSPLAAQLRHSLEGSVGAAWEAESEVQQDQANRGEILGGWFMWALRDAVRDAGHYESGRFPADYYLTLAHEVNDACERGTLECFAPRATMLPVWRNHYAREWPASFIERLREMVGFRTTTYEPLPSNGGPEQLALFRWLVGEITPRDTHYVVLELAARGGNPAVRVLDPDGNVIPSDQTDAPAATLVSDLRNTGWSGPALRAERRTLQVRCVRACALEITLDGTGIVRLPFADLTPATDAILEDGLLYQVVAVDAPYEPSPVQQQAADIHRAVLSAIRDTYRVLLPPLAVGVLALHLMLSWALLKRRGDTTLWFVLTACVILVAARIALIAYMNVSSLRNLPGSYLHEAYPPMLAWIGIGAAALIERVQPGILRRRRSDLP